MYNIVAMIDYYFKSLKKKDIQKLTEARAGVLIVAHELNKGDMQTLLSLGYNEALLEDANDYFEVPRFEHEQGVNYLFTRYVVSTSTGELSTAPLLIAISEEHVLCVSNEEPDFLKPYFDYNIEGSFITTQKVRLVINMVEDILRRYDKTIMNIRRTMLKHFKQVEHIDEADIKEFVILESTLADYLSALSPMQTALTQMLRGKNALVLHQEDAGLVEDLIQDMNQLIESVKGISNTMQNIRSGHSSIIANKLNITMKRLTAVTIILTIPTIIASLFGMNTWVPLSKGPISFILILLIITAISYSVGRFFIKSKWI